jgi:hypothetical protein
MRLIETDEIKSWSVAKKTRPIKAKPMVSLMVDRSVTSKFLVDTLEGKESLGDGSIMCVGESGDAWQQMPSKLLAKYDVTSIDPEGWMTCTPKPENSVECYQITGETEHVSKNLWADPEPYCIMAEWGEDTVMVNVPIKIQRAEIGDYICRNRTNPSDIWIVRKKIFNSTYVIIN